MSTEESIQTLEYFLSMANKAGVYTLAESNQILIALSSIHQALQPKDN
jgi:hypothetical protein